jgi:hypothetical protein
VWQKEFKGKILIFLEGFGNRDCLKNFQKFLNSLSGLAYTDKTKEVLGL